MTDQWADAIADAIKTVQSQQGANGRLVRGQMPATSVFASTPTATGVPVHFHPDGTQMTPEEAEERAREIAVEEEETRAAEAAHAERADANDELRRRVQADSKELRHQEIDVRNAGWRADLEARRAALEPR